jgi:hypothetical protein
LTTGRVDQGACNRLFIQGFGDTTRRRIEARLTFILPNHHPDDPYNLTDVKEAAEFLLSAMTACGHNGPSDKDLAIAAPPSVKQEPMDMASLQTFMKNSIQESIREILAKGPAAAATPATNPVFPSASPNCHFCGGAGCRIRSCT